MQGNSEVARLLENIRLSFEAAQRALQGPAIVARHEFITTKMEHMQQAHAQLQTMVGEREAMQLMAKALDTPAESEEASH